MPVEVPVFSDHVRKAFLRTLDLAPQKRSDYFGDLRNALRDAFREAMADAGVATASWAVRPQLSRSRAVDSGTPIQHRSGVRQEQKSLDAAFCAGYGIDDYSVGAINYLCGGHARFPSLRAFLDVDRFSAGNIVVPLMPSAGELFVRPSPPMRVVGHIIETGPRKRKPYVALLGVHFESAALRAMLGDAVGVVSHSTCDAGWLDEVVVHPLAFPILYICRYCGTLHTCECFRAHIDAAEQRRHLGSHPEHLARVESMGFVSGLCHLCRGGIPRHVYGSAMYYSSFGQRFRPYVELFARRQGRRADADQRDAENEARARFGFPAIGERWVSETLLFRVVEGLVAPREVVHHYRGKELDGLELDIWIPDLRLGIEYQGKQHYQAIKHWGGDEALAKRRANDRRKRALCQQLGYKLIGFRFDEELTESAVQARLKRHLEPNELV